MSYEERMAELDRRMAELRRWMVTTAWTSGGVFLLIGLPVAYFWSVAAGGSIMAVSGSVCLGTLLAMIDTRRGRP